MHVRPRFASHLKPSHCTDMLWQTLHMLRWMLPHLAAITPPEVAAQGGQQIRAMHRVATAQSCNRCYVNVGPRCFGRFNVRSWGYFYSEPSGKGSSAFMLPFTYRSTIASMRSCLFGW